MKTISSCIESISTALRCSSKSDFKYTVQMWEYYVGLKYASVSYNYTAQSILLILKSNFTWVQYIILLRNPSFIYSTILSSILSFTFKLCDVGDCLPHWVAQPWPLFDPLWTVTGKLRCVYSVGCVQEYGTAYRLQKSIFSKKKSDLLKKVWFKKDLEIQIKNLKFKLHLFELK